MPRCCAGIAAAKINDAERTSANTDRLASLDCLISDLIRNSLFDNRGSPDCTAINLFGRVNPGRSIDYFGGHEDSIILLRDAGFL